MAVLKKSTIIFNYRQAMKKADELDSIANSLRHLSDVELEDGLQNVSVSWKGDNARQYLGEGMKLQEKISAASSQLHDIAEETRRAARRIYNAEMANLEIAKRRDY